MRGEEEVHSPGWRGEERVLRSPGRTPPSPPRTSSPTPRPPASPPLPPNLPNQTTLDVMTSLKYVKESVYRKKVLIKHSVYLKNSYLRIKISPSVGENPISSCYTVLPIGKVAYFV